MDQSYLSITILFILQINYCQCKGGKSKSKDATSVRKDVIVVGGGIAGMAAARRLVQEGNFNVKVFEARKDRYGGRIWTNRNAAKGIKGVDVEMGAMFLNTKGKSESLHQLVKEFELRTENSGTVNVYFPEKDAETKVYGAEAATQLYTEAIKILVKAVNKVKKSNIDRPLLDVIHEELDKTYAETESPKYSKDAVTKIINTLPTPLCQNFSALSYEIEHEFGWDSIIVDGMDAFLDRLVAGSRMEVPLKIELNKIVVNIEIDKKRNKVKVRTNDRRQAVVDAVVVAVPAGVLKNRLIVFEPKLSREWENAMTELGVGYSSKVVVGFSKAFWPRDVGSFTVSSQTASDGFLQMWTNAYRLSGNPYLVGNIFGEKAKHWESVPIKDLKERVKIILGQMFGSENVNAHNMTTFVHSEWSTDPLVMGSVSYPRVGNKPDLWDTLKKPVCPYIYFAGAYTESTGHVDSVHGAYNSGLRAAEQIISNICKTKKSSSETKSKSNKADKDIKKKKKLKEMKDEL